MMTATADRRAFWIATAVVLGLLGFAGFFLLGRETASRGTPGAGAGAPVAGEAAYHCPMHPAMVSDKPGDCPICGMRMVPNERGGEGAASAPSPAPRRRIVYRSTMNPGEVSDRPGVDSMGMEMEAVEVEEGPAAVTPVEGQAGVRISPRKQQLIGVKTGIVQRGPFVRTIRAVGRVTADEARLHHVHTKFEGWIETLYVNATGVKVEKGQPLLSIYSPELLATQEEYLVALRARKAMGEGTLPEASGRAGDLVESGRRRLLLYDFTPAQIDQLEATGQPMRTVTLYSPISGYVIERKVTQGEKIDAATTLLDIADLSRVWVIASVYEYELPFIRVGQRAAVTLSYLPGKSYQGRVGVVYPVLEASTRTVQVRLDFPNPDLNLKPEMYADVEIRSDLGERLIVPDSAVVSSGTRSIVFVVQGDGYFTPRQVRIGFRLPDGVEVLEGLKEGEEVVTSGNFLIDSESKLKSALESAAAPPKEK
jgi:RND family efflux transporter MFP subunit